MLIIDPDDLNQGDLNNVTDLAFTASSGIATTLTGSGTLPALADNEYFEIRSHSIPGNNGLYRVNDAGPTTSSVTADKIAGPNPTDQSAESTDVLGTTGASSEKSVHFDTDALELYLIEQGNLDSAGVQMLAFHSFCKIEWKSDNLLISAAAFPMIGISFAAGQWQFGTDPSGNNSGWKPAENHSTETDLQTRRLFRDAGWDEIDFLGITIRKYFGVITLGTFEDGVNDRAYYSFGTDNTDTGAAVDYEYAGPVNEAVKFFEEFGNPGSMEFTQNNEITRVGDSFIVDGYQVGGQVTIRNADTGGNDGSFVLTAVNTLTMLVAGTPFTTETDANAQLAVDNDNAFTTSIRVRDGDPKGKTFQTSVLSNAGETEISSKVIKFPLANATDQDISETDANITANLPYTEIRLRYLDAAYNREVDSGVKRNFGIIVDVGTHSRQNGASNTDTSFLSANFQLGAGEALADYTGGKIIIHEGTDQGTHTIVGTPTEPGGVLTVVLSGALTATEASLSFTMERPTPLTATKNEIYEKIHFQLRQDTDIDELSSTVIGRTADDLMTFVGADLNVGIGIPSNPNGGGTGVLIEGFDANDTNNLFFFDNGETKRNFPFVAAGNLSFNQGLVDDSDGEFWLYFEYTTRTNLSDAAVVGPSGDTYDLESPGSFLPALLVNDYIFIPSGGFADEASNGLFIVTVVGVSTQDYTVRSVNGVDVGSAESAVTIDVDQNPYPSPDAIVVDDNSDVDIVGPIGAISIAFDFDFDNNTQGGRSAASNANVVLVAAGLETAQVAVVKGLVISRAVGLAFAVTAATERNFLNPA